MLPFCWLCSFKQMVSITHVQLMSRKKRAIRESDLFYSHVRRLSHREYVSAWLEWQIWHIVDLVLSLHVLIQWSSSKHINAWWMRISEQGCSYRIFEESDIALKIPLNNRIKSLVIVVSPQLFHLVASSEHFQKIKPFPHPLSLCEWNKHITPHLDPSAWKRSWVCFENVFCEHRAVSRNVCIHAKLLKHCNTRNRPVDDAVHTQQRRINRAYMRNTTNTVFLLSAVLIVHLLAFQKVASFPCWWNNYKTMWSSVQNTMVWALRLNKWWLKAENVLWLFICNQGTQITRGTVSPLPQWIPLLHK